VTAGDRSVRTRRLSLDFDGATLARIEDAIAIVVADIDPAELRGQMTAEHFRQVLALELSAADRALMGLDHPSVVAAALDRSSETFADASRDTGMPSTVQTLLWSWVSIQLEARDLQRRAELNFLLTELVRQLVGC
jgi:hypothetical protein